MFFWRACSALRKNGILVGFVAEEPLEWLLRRVLLAGLTTSSCLGFWLSGRRRPFRLEMPLYW